MKDRITRGFIAGIISGIVPFALNFGSYYINFTTARWSEFMGVLLFGSPPATIGKVIFAVIAVFIFLGFLGTIFALTVPLVSSRSYLLKGFMYGTAIWFISFSATTFFQIAELQAPPLKTAVTNFISASLWGIMLGLTLNWVDDRLKQEV